MSHIVSSLGKTSTKSDPYDASMFATRNDRWLTPLPIIHALGRFDLDPAGAPGHDTAAEVWTPEEHGDGLSMPWHGRVWLNPPYGRTMPLWIERLAEHGHGTALVFARTDTALFHEHVFPRASGLMFLRRRPRFLHPDGQQAASNAGAPVVLIAYGSVDLDALAGADLDGHLVKLAVDR